MLVMAGDAVCVHEQTQRTSNAYNSVLLMRERTLATSSMLADLYWLRHVHLLDQHWVILLEHYPLIPLQHHHQRAWPAANVLATLAASAERQEPPSDQVVFPGTCGSGCVNFTSCSCLKRPGQQYESSINSCMLWNHL